MSKQTLGRGANATVYLIRNFRKNKMVARKRLRVCNARGKKEMEKEIAIQTAASAAGLAPEIIDVNMRYCTIDMELSGESLHDICERQHGVTETQQRQIIHLIKGLVTAKIAHGDLHPRNILRHNESTLVAIDFGKAKMNVDFQRGGSPNQFMGQQLHGLLYHKDVGLVTKNVIPAAPTLDEQMTKWGVPPPSSRRKKRPRE